jgi:hypothetical protein
MNGFVPGSANPASFAGCAIVAYAAPVFLAVRVRRLVDPFLLVRGQSLRHQRDQHVVGLQHTEQPPVGGLVGLAPDIDPLGDLERVEQRLVGELRGQFGAFAAVCIGFGELRNPGAVGIECRRERSCPKLLEVREDGREHLAVIGEARRRQVGVGCATIRIRRCAPTCRRRAS